MNTHKRSEVHARLNPSDFTTLQAIAIERNVTLSEVVREAVKGFLARSLITDIKPSPTLEALKELEKLREAVSKPDDKQLEQFQAENARLHQELHYLKLQNEKLEIERKKWQQQLDFFRSELSNLKRILAERQEMKSPIINNNYTNNEEEEEEEDKEEELNWI